MKIVFAFIITLLSVVYAYAGELTKQQSFHHSVTEVGTIQVRLLTKYFKDGKFIDQEYGDPYTPADPNDMIGWDDRSKDIVAAIIDPATVAAFKAEKQTKTGIGLEEIVTYDREVNPINCTHDEISIREIHRTFDNGVEVLKKYVRSWIMPGDDPSAADIMSKAVALKIHTPEVIAAYEAALAAASNP